MGMALVPADDQVHGLLEAHVLAQGVPAAVVLQLVQEAVGRAAGGLGVGADLLLHLLVGDLDALGVGDGLDHQLATDARPRRRGAAPR